MRVGVISDTHDYLNPRIFDVFAEVERILHAGDMNSVDMIIELSAIAPVIAVRGNMDPVNVGTRYPEDQRVILAGNDVFMTHNGGLLLRNPKEFKARCGSKRPDVFIWGHTHKAENKMDNGMLSLNPGSASRPMLELPPSVAILTLGPNENPRAEIVFLEG
jgi:putative phosphoesterase